MNIGFSQFIRLIGRLAAMIWVVSAYSNLQARYSKSGHYLGSKSLFQSLSRPFKKSKLNLLVGVHQDVFASVQIQFDGRGPRKGPRG